MLYLFKISKVRLAMISALILTPNLSYGQNKHLLPLKALISGEVIFPYGDGRFFARTEQGYKDLTNSTGLINLGFAGLVILISGSTVDGDVVVSSSWRGPSAFRFVSSLGTGFVAMMSLGSSMPFEGSSSSTQSFSLTDTKNETTLHLQAKANQNLRKDVLSRLDLYNLDLTEKPNAGRSISKEEELEIFNLVLSRLQKTGTPITPKQFNDIVAQHGAVEKGVTDVIAKALEAMELPTKSAPQNLKKKELIQYLINSIQKRSELASKDDNEFLMKYSLHLTELLELEQEAGR